MKMEGKWECGLNYLRIFGSIDFIDKGMDKLLLLVNIRTTRGMESGTFILRKKPCNLEIIYNTFKWRRNL